MRLMPSWGLHASGVADRGTKNVQPVQRACIGCYPKFESCKTATDSVRRTRSTRIGTAKCGAKLPEPCRTRSRDVPQDEVNRLVKLATRWWAEQPIFVVDRDLIESNLGGWANWSRLVIFTIWKTQKRRMKHAPFCQFLLGFIRFF